MLTGAKKATSVANSSGSIDGPERRPDDIFQAILGSALPSEEKTIPRLSQDGFLSITAGGDPPARTLAAGVYHVLSSPHTLKRLHNELDQVMPDPRVLAHLHTLEALPYLVSRNK